MGKAANNEIKKLRATFFNNVGVGCFLTGCIIPFFSLYADLGLKDVTVFQLLGRLHGQTIAGVITAWMFAGIFHSLATGIASRIED
jgi:hypothetical protein